MPSTIKNATCQPKLLATCTGVFYTQKSKVTLVFMMKVRICDGCGKWGLLGLQRTMTMCRGWLLHQSEEKRYSTGVWRLTWDDLVILGMDAQQTGIDELSDYGSDFNTDEEVIVNELLRDAGSLVPHARVTIIEDNDQSKNRQYYNPQGYLRPSSISPEPWLQKEIIAGSVEIGRLASINESSMCTLRAPVTKAGLWITKRAVRTADSRPNANTTASVESTSETKVPEQDDSQLDTRTPLQRFRSKPKRALSVTDLVSPSWCELQYWYSLTKHGKKRPTPAMRQGSVVHKVLEDQVHREVEVEVQNKEDAWGLRLWNIIQGLRGLRETGLTRELEIWGVLDGEVVNGVIDEVSFHCPDEEMENRAAARGQSKKKEQSAADQMSLDSFFKRKRAQESQKVSSSADPRPGGDCKIYLTDVKTRTLRSLPTGASFRPTAMQLMLYHTLLSELAEDRVNSDVIFDRYSLNPDLDFSDTFLASILSLSELSHDNSVGPTSFIKPSADQDSPLEFLNYKTLRQLWAAMIQEFQNILPHGAKSIGQVLKVEYRSQNDGEVLGEKHFPFDKDAIHQYVQDEMKWWKGERAAQGVCIEEAYKCRICEFADECEWRKRKVNEATEAHRSRSQNAV